jgi:hypothetical protein
VLIVEVSTMPSSGMNIQQPPTTETLSRHAPSKP